MATKKKPEKKEGQPLFTVGKRRRAVARATFRPGKGIIKMNAVPIELLQNPIIRMRLQEPLVLIGDAVKQFDVDVNTSGGGVLGQAEAARQAISRGFAEALGEDTRKMLLSYDRHLLVYDARRTEPHKPPRSSQGPRRYKQRSKR